MTRPLGVRGRLLVSVGIVVASALVVMVGGFNLLLRNSLERDATNLARTRASLALATLGTGAGPIRVAEAPDGAAVDAQVWVFDGRRALESPPLVSASVTGAVQGIVGGSPRVVDSRDGVVRLASVPIFRGSHLVGTVIAGVTLSPYRQTASVALRASVALAVGLFLVVMLIAAWSLRRALRPVTTMTERAQDWSVNDPGRRFAAGPPYDELTHLAATLDGLLDRLSASMRREQRFSAEMSHELRTPLARIAAEVELGLARERATPEYRSALAAIGRSAAQMARTIDALIAAAREEASSQHGTSDAREVIAQAADQASAIAVVRGVVMSVEVPSGLQLGVHGDHAARVLAPVLENACRHAASSVSVTASHTHSSVRVLVEDDGPGVAVADRERIFEPGNQGRENNPGGAGLGLALARRLARSVDGEVDCLAQQPGGRFQVQLPIG